jgi:protein required for attachment to host cells
MKPCIVIADKARARFFTVDEANDSPFEEKHRHLREYSDLVNPEGTLTDQEVFRDRSAGRGARRMSVGGGGYGSDDGKGMPRRESVRRFAKELATAASELVRSQKSKELVLVASPKFLGIVRAEVRKAIPKTCGLTELGEDLSRQGTAQIEKVLARHGAFDTTEPVVAYRRRARTKRTKGPPVRSKKARSR